MKVGCDDVNLHIQQGNCNSSWAFNHFQRSRKRFACFYLSIRNVNLWKFW